MSLSELGGMIWMRISEADAASTEKTAGGVMTGVSGAGDSVGSGVAGTGLGATVLTGVGGAVGLTVSCTGSLLS